MGGTHSASLSSEEEGRGTKISGRRECVLPQAVSPQAAAMQVNRSWGSVQEAGIGQAGNSQPVGNFALRAMESHPPTPLQTVTAPAMAEGANGAGQATSGPTASGVVYQGLVGVAASSADVVLAAPREMLAEQQGRRHNRRRRRSRSSSTSGDSDRRSVTYRGRHSHSRRRSVSRSSRRFRRRCRHSSSSSRSRGRSSGRSLQYYRTSQEEQSGRNEGTAPVMAATTAAETQAAVSGTCPSGQPAGNAMSWFHMAGARNPLMPLVRMSVAPGTWHAYGVARPCVWILGHSYVFLAEQRAELRPGGRSLGFQNIEVNWRGIRGLSWSQVLFEVVQISRMEIQSVILVLHAGGNDLGAIHLTELITMMKADMEKFPSFFTKLVMVWSEIIPRVVWSGERDWASIERVRRAVNHRISRFVYLKGGIIVRHRQLEGKNNRLLRPDGVHLTDIGLDIFLSGLQDGIEEALFAFGGGS